MDIMFAIDSIPAIFAITSDTFIVYTSNIFAILGLRSLFFALSSLLKMFEYLHYGISCVLVFVGAKMLLSHYYPIRTDVSLAVIGGILLVTIIASVLHREDPKPPLRVEKDFQPRLMQPKNAERIVQSCGQCGCSSANRLHEHP